MVGVSPNEYYTDGQYRFADNGSNGTVIYTIQGDWPYDTTDVTVSLTPAPVPRTLISASARHRPARIGRNCIVQNEVITVEFTLIAPFSVDSPEGTDSVLSGGNSPVAAEARGRP